MGDYLGPMDIHPSQIHLETELNCWMLNTSLELEQELSALCRSYSNLKLAKYHGAELDKISSDLSNIPDVLLLESGQCWLETVTKLSNMPWLNQAHILVFGLPDDSQAMRQAFKINAKDFITLPLNPLELEQNLKEVAKQRNQHTDYCPVTVFVNSKGGMGASLLASNTGYLLASQHNKNTLLLDLDQQFGCVSYYLGITPKYSLAQALKMIHELDEAALEGIVSKHKSGLDILPSPHETQSSISNESSAIPFRELLKKLRTKYDHIVVDMSRGPEPWCQSVLHDATTIYMVVQQSVTCLRDAARMLSGFELKLGLNKTQVVTVINRYHPRGDINRKAVEKTLNQQDIISVPNDFKLASEATNLGLAMYELAPRKPLTRTLIDITNQIEEPEIVKATGWFSWFRRGR